MKRTITCPRCNGLGTIPMFSHIDQGMCYSCLGTGTVEIVDNGEWEIYRDQMLRIDDFEVNDTKIVDCFSNKTLFALRTKEWARKVYFVLSMWTCEMGHPNKAVSRLNTLKNEKSPVELAKAINSEFARAEDRPYYLHNKDTYESIPCDKNGNPL